MRPEFHHGKKLKCLNGAVPVSNHVILCIGNVQLDNQMFKRHPYEFPIIIFGDHLDDKLDKTRVPTSVQSQLVWEQLKQDSLVVIQLTLDVSDNNRSTLRSVKVKSQPWCVYIEDKLIHRLSSILTTFKTPEIGCSKATYDSELPCIVKAASRNLVHSLDLEELLIDPININLSIHASIKMYLGLDQTPLNFGSFERKNLMTTHYCLGQSLARHYISGALFRAGWVVGSLDLIGSPAGFTRTVGVGVKDFVALPYEGIIQVVYNI